MPEIPPDNPTANEKIEPFCQWLWKVIVTTLCAVIMRPPEEYWKWTEVKKFNSVFLLFFLVAIVWHIGIFIIPRPESDRVLARHDLTFLIAHPFLFAPALGLMYSVLDKDLLSELSWRERGVLSLYVFIVLSICVFTALRHNYSFGVQCPWLCGMETWVFMTAIGVFIWYCLALIWHRRMTDYVFLRLSCAAALFALWVPLRVYANWAMQRTQTSPNCGLIGHWWETLVNSVGAAFGYSGTGSAGSEAKFAMLVAFLFLSCFVVLAAIQFAGNMRKELVASVVAAGSFLATITLSANPAWFEAVYEMIENDLKIERYIALAVMALTMILSLAKYLLKNEL